MPITPFEIRRGEAGCRRNQLIDPRPGVVRADVEDDFHSFWLEITHDGEHVLDLRTSALRWPWTTCPAAGLYLGERMKGARLDSLAQVDSALSHCTHQHDLALLAAAHAHDAGPTLYSTFASDRMEPTRTAELYRNGEPELLWEIEGSDIMSPGIGHGLSLRRLKEWEVTLSPHEREAARVLRRTIFIAGGRFFDYEATPTADTVAQSVGACYTFQPIRSAGAALTMEMHDYSDGGIPLRDRIEEVARARA
ncbi:hypothetical protein BH10PSE13_BH10PSE13_03420 [soil metagenome]